MLQKLKRTSIFVSALAMIMSLGYVGTVAASTSSSQFACYDSTIALNVSAPNAKHEVGVTCKSGAGINYLNFQNQRYVSVTVVCPGTESYGTSAPAKVGDPYLFYCVTISGQGDKQTSTRSGHDPTVTPPKDSGSTVDTGGSSTGTQPAGTCFVHDPSGNKTQKCQTAIGDPAGRKDSDGNALDYTKNCYEVDSNTSSSTITHVNCDGTAIASSSSGGSAPTCSNDTGNTCSATDSAAVSGNCSNISQCDLIVKYVDPLINLLSALVGLIVVISVVIGGIQYGSSGGDPQKITAAKNRIRNAIIALVTFVLLYAMLNFLIPGGLV